MKITLLQRSAISHPSERFCGWPTVARRANGELVAVYSGGRSRHVCPYGRIHFSRSRDEGQTWDRAVTLSCGPLDDRDAGIVETKDGHLVVVWFSSLAYERALEAGVPFQGKLPAEEQVAWNKIRDAIDDRTRLAELGCWARISRDGGRSWGKRITTLVNSPHGPIALKDGRLFYAGRFQAKDGIGVQGSPFVRQVGAAESLDGGQTWRKISEIAPMSGHDGRQYGELHAVEAADGRIVVHIRNNTEEPQNEILQTESFDGGRSWSEVRSIGVWGYPCHLLRLQDGRLLASYSHRREPRENRVILSTNHGSDWSEPLTLSNEAESSDFGYPSTVQLNEEEFYSIWYSRTTTERHARVHGARWRLES